jgi:hypothetical protein
MRAITLTAVAALGVGLGTAPPAPAQYYSPYPAYGYAGGFSPYAVTPSYGYNVFSPYGYNPNVYFSLGPRYYNYGYYPGYTTQFYQWTWNYPAFGAWR